VDDRTERLEKFERERSRILKTVEEIKKDKNFSRGQKERMITIAYQTIADKRLEYGV